MCMVTLEAIEYKGEIYVLPRGEVDWMYEEGKNDFEVLNTKIAQRYIRIYEKAAIFDREPWEEVEVMYYKRKYLVTFMPDDKIGYVKIKEVK